MIDPYEGGLSWGFRIQINFGGLFLYTYILNYLGAQAAQPCKHLDDVDWQACLALASFWSRRGGIGTYLRSLISVFYLLPTSLLRPGVYLPS
jgi:hypothetical protein